MNEQNQNILKSLELLLGGFREEVIKGLQLYLAIGEE